MFIKRLLLLNLLFLLQACGSADIAEPVFLVSDEKISPSEASDTPPIRVQATASKPYKKNTKVYEAPEVDEAKDDPNSEAPKLKEILLTTISTDYTDRTYDLILTFDDKQLVNAIKTKSNKGKVKIYPLNVLDREVVLVKAVGVALVTLVCKNFKQEKGCPIEIEYPSNVTYGKFLRFQAELVQAKDTWQLESRGRPFTSMHLVAKKLFGLLIGVDRIELR